MESYNSSSESSLPDAPTGDLKHEKPRASSIVDRLVADIGLEGVFSHSASHEATPEKDIVWIFDNTALQEGDSWSAEFVAAFFERHSARDFSKVIAYIADKLGLQDGTEHSQAAKQRIEDRVRPFLLDIAPAKWLSVEGTLYQTKLGPSARNGIYSHVLDVKPEENGAVALTKALKNDLLWEGTSETKYASPDGWLFVSDIDDSIKITMTPDITGILKSTFVSDPEPIAGMPDLYAHIDSQFKPAWFYVSASPYNLYTFLRPFLRQHYPHGTMILKDFSWQDLSSVIDSFRLNTQAFKVDRISKIHSWLPDRKVLCLGDSTQFDPEAYGEIYRRFPGWVKKIFIRKVTDVSGLDKDSVKNQPQRFETAFKDVPGDVWQVFEDPKELYAAVDEVKARYEGQ